jgi:hypothetical protein
VKSAEQPGERRPNCASLLPPVLTGPPGDAGPGAETERNQSRTGRRDMNDLAKCVARLTPNFKRYEAVVSKRPAPATNEAGGMRTQILAPATSHSGA